MSDAAQATAPTDRRDFLLKLGTGAGVAALTAQAAASLRSLVPNVSYDSPTTVKLGLPADFPDGIKFLPDERLFVFRDGKTFHAISAVCTHLGCIVRWNDTEKTWDCPCHGSRFDRFGHVMNGPANRDLPAISANGGALALAPDRYETACPSLDAAELHASNILTEAGRRIWTGRRRAGSTDWLAS